MTDPKSTELDDLFAEMRAQDVPQSDDLMARILADAEALQPVVPGLIPEPPQSRWAGFMDIIGGWPALSGVAAAGVAGLWLGVAPPSSLEQLTADVLGTSASVTLLGDLGGLVEDTIDG